MGNTFRICIISGKLGDVDGVSLEVDKWIHTLRQMGHSIFTIAGKYVNELDGIPPEHRIIEPGIRFDSPEQKHYEKTVFPHLNRNPLPLNGNKRKNLLEEMTLRGSEIAGRLFELIQDRDIDLIIADNTNAMPMTLLGGLAVHELATVKRVATLFHHHDFWWERSRFSHNYIESLLTRIMPPADLGTEHVVLTSYAAHILSSLKRVQPEVIPNCEDFNNPTRLDEYNREFRKDLGFKEDDILIVQPTRVVKRKRIEDSVELVHRLVRKYPRLKNRIHFLVSLYQGDESDEYYIEEIKEKAHQADIPLHLIHDRISSVRKTNEQGERLYTNRDVLANADFITYLPFWEGFGNALLEAIAARKPLVITTYLVYKTDIKVTGLQNVEIRDAYDKKGRLLIPDQSVEQIHYLLTHPDERNELVERNFEIARKEFGFETLHTKLKMVLTDYTDEIRASRKRITKSKLRYSV